MTGYRYHYSELYSCPIHPRALELADFPFFWDACDENAPFGSDEGYEALVYYWDWEEKNKNSPLEKCLYNFLYLRYSEERANTLMKFCFIPYEQYAIESENYLESNIIFDIYELDQYIASIGFGSFVKFGKVHHSFKKHMTYAIERMYKPVPESSKSIYMQEKGRSQVLMIYEKLMDIIEVK